MLIVYTDVWYSWTLDQIAHSSHLHIFFEGGFGRVYRYIPVVLLAGVPFFPKWRVPVVEFVPNHTGVFGTVLRTHPTNTGTPGIIVEGIPVSN